MPSWSSGCTPMGWRCCGSCCRTVWIFGRCGRSASMRWSTPMATSVAASSTATTAAWQASSARSPWRAWPTGRGVGPTCTRSTRRWTCRPRSTPTGCAGWPPWKLPAGRSPTPGRPSNGPLGCGWASGRWRTWPLGQRSTLTASTARTAASQKLATRLSKGEKRHRKRMAEIAAVYDLTPAARTVADILPDGDDERRAARLAPAATGKWLSASVTDDAKEVIAAGFDEADRRDPDHKRTWVALVDGNTHQIDRIRAEARARKVAVPVVVDFIHALEYVWKAAWCFFTEADPRAEQWVRTQARAILAGRAGIVASAIRRKATYHGLDPGQRRNADTAAAYLLAKKPYLDYPTALAAGWPIATGVIEGACRHLVKDRLDITGARWGLAGAEAILKLRALISNGDFDQYWTWHLTQEQQLIHNSRYLGGVIPTQ